MPLVGLAIPQLKKRCTTKTTRVSCAASSHCGCFFTTLIVMKPTCHANDMLDLQPSRCGLRVRAYAFDTKPGNEAVRHLDT